MTLGSLDFLYTPSADVAADLRYLVDVLGAEEVFAIEDGGIRVAMASFGGPPAILLTDHLEGDRPIHLFAVTDLAAARPISRRAAGPGALGRAAAGPGHDLPNAHRHSHGHLRADRPFVVESFRGRHDF